MRRKTIVCFGDSNTHGFDVRTGGRFPKDKRWPGRISLALGDEYEVHEEGLNGRTSVFEDPLFEGLNGFTALPIIMGTHEPLDLLIIMLGTNDTKERFNANATNICRGLEHLVEKAKVNKSWRREPRILLMAPLEMKEDYRQALFGESMGDGCSKKSRELPALLKDMARRQRIDFLDLNEMPGVEFSNKDFMHLSEEAHEALANVVEAWIRQNL